MTTPHMKMAIEELQEEQLRNAAEAKSIYWYPSEFNGVRQWLEGVLLDITLMDRRYVGEVYSRRLRPDIVLAKRVPKYITVEAENPPSGKDEKPGYVYSVDTDGGCTPKKLSYEALTALATPTTPPQNEDGSIGTNQSRPCHAGSWTNTNLEPSVRHGRPMGRYVYYRMWTDSQTHPSNMAPHHQLCR